MAKLTKAQLKAHNRAVELLKKENLTWDDRHDILEFWNEAADHTVSESGAFFTPVGLARDFAIEACGLRTIDLCAGIGVLSFFQHSKHNGYGEPNRSKIVCVERNPVYVEIGKKILPQAEWICCDVFDFRPEMVTSFDAVKEGFDVAISNPPFGKIRGGTYQGPYTGSNFEYKVIEFASRLAAFGAFIVPQGSAPFNYSGNSKGFQEIPNNEKYKKFKEQTGISLSPGCGIDTSIYREDWKNTNVMTEVVLADFQEGGVFNA